MNKKIRKDKHSRIDLTIQNTKDVESSGFIIAVRLNNRRKVLQDSFINHQIF